MTRLALALALAALWAGVAAAKPPGGDGPPPLELPERGDFAGHVEFAAAGGPIFCEVWRDYYFDADTGEFYGWAGAPYIKSETCTSVGGGDGTGPNCAPGDLACLCGGTGNRDNPACEGRGPLLPSPQPPEQCEDTAAADTACATAGGGGCSATCKEDKRKACNACIEQTKAANRKIADDHDKCLQQADVNARTWCMQGRLPNGRRFGNWTRVDSCIDANRPLYKKLTRDQIYEKQCRGVSAINPEKCTIDWHGDSICETREEFTDCLNLWTYGRDATQRTQEVGGDAEWSAGGATVSLGGKETITVTWPAGTGTYEACDAVQRAQKQLRTDVSAECKGAVNARYKGGATCR